MIITSHMHKIIHIYPCLLKLSHKQESVTDGRIDGKTDGQTDDRYYYIPHRYHGGIIKLDGAWKMCLANGPPMIDYKKLTHYELLLVVFVHAISVLSPYKDHLFTTCPMSEMCIEYNLQS